MTGADAAAQPLPPSLIERLSGGVALLGGLLSLCTALLVVVSVIGRRFFDSPINGDFELVQMATAIAIFSFLPYCQSRRGNILVDTFTTWLPPRTNAYIDAFWDIVYAGMMGVITVCLFTGVLEHYRSRQTTMLLQLIVWPALAVCAALSLLLVLVALTTAVRLVRGRA
ncbi:MAG: TRAP transporter small permease [Hyphomicrobiaceae bacterium]|nr:MAG: TRAP transporter small permease [Hyphomicrobiaceae bacterium]